MDSDAKARITRNIDTKKPIAKELEKYFGYKPRSTQVKAIRSYTDKATAEAKDRMTLNTRNGRYYWRDKDGNFVRQVKHADHVFFNPKNGEWYRQNPKTGKWTNIEE